MKRLRLLMYYAVWLGCPSLSGATAYYVDSQLGSDTNDGMETARAWKSLERVNRQMFGPGDKILFKAGTRYVGQFKPQGSGKLVGGNPETILAGMYGTGAKPRIDGEGRVLDAVLLRNVEYWEIRDLEVTNHGETPKPWQSGVNIVSDGFGTMHHIIISNLYVHDVNGDLRKDHEGCGIFFESKGGKKSCFDGLDIENCHVVKTDRNGICQKGGWDARSKRVIIRGNLLEDIGGDGIKPWGSDGALVEHNIVKGGRMRAQDAAAGIWPFACDNTVIQFNEVSGMKGTLDGEGFDSDYICRNSLFQYNYSHDNEGGFMLVCAPGDSYCEGTVIRYNISQNDGINSGRVFHFGGGSNNTRVYNNVIYVGKHQDLPMLVFGEWNGGNALNTTFSNNIFYVDGRVTYQWGKSRNNVFENNVFYGNHEGMPNDPGAFTKKPPLRNPGGGRDGIGTLDCYKLAGTSGFPRGKPIPNNGGRDFFGNPVSSLTAPCRGVFEAR